MQLNEKPFEMAPAVQTTRPFNLQIDDGNWDEWFYTVLITLPNLNGIIIYAFKCFHFPISQFQ